MTRCLLLANATATACGLALWTSAASAARPTEGGLFHYDADETIEHWDEPSGRVRVHFSVKGRNQTILASQDGDAVPDFAQLVAELTAKVIDHYTDKLGLRTPLVEEDLGLGALGGSDALDVYLVDFAGNGDGAFGIDACRSRPNHCVGFLQVENDFVGYGYSSIEHAANVLASHELFHGVQAAYDASQGSWFSEGTAVWAERQWEADSADFMWLCNAYLKEPTRSLNSPPLGPVPAWSYGTALWWDFLTLRHGTELMQELLAGTESSTSVPANTLQNMKNAIEARGDSLSSTWMRFAQWNLATGKRFGKATTYPYAKRLGLIEPAAQGAHIDDTNRFYPLATTYYRLDHAGGPIWFALDKSASQLQFSLSQVDGGASDGPVLDPKESWTGQEHAPRALANGASLPAGGYWLIGAQAEIAENSVRVRVCLGSEATARQCDTSSADAGVTDAEAPDAHDASLSDGHHETGPIDAGEEHDSSGSVEPPKESTSDEGSSCAVSQQGMMGKRGLGLLFMLMSLVWYRRRRSR